MNNKNKNRLELMLYYNNNKYKSNNNKKNKKNKKNKRNKLIQNKH